MSDQSDETITIEIGTNDYWLGGRGRGWNMRRRMGLDPKQRSRWRAILRARRKWPLHARSS